MTGVLNGEDECRYIIIKNKHTIPNNEKQALKYINLQVIFKYNNNNVYLSAKWIIVKSANE